MVSEKIPMLKFLTSPDTWPIKNMWIVSPEHTPVAQFILCMIFLIHVATVQHLNYDTSNSREESKQEVKKHNLHFVFLTPVALKQSQDHQTYNENLDPEQGYNHAKFERSRFSSVWDKGDLQIFSNKDISQLSPLNMCRNKKWWYSWSTLHNQQPYKVLT